MKTQRAADFRFDHSALPVSDARSAYELFANVLELPLIAAYEGDDWGGAAWLMMIFGLSDGGQVALCARAGAEPYRPSAIDLPHFALGVESMAQLAQWRSRLRSAGFEIRDEDHGEQRSIYFEDRSGLTWEITTRAPASSPDPDAHSLVSSWIAAH